MDYKIGGGRIYWRVQGDFIGTNVGPPGFRRTILSEQAWFSTSKGRGNRFFNGRYVARKLRSMPAFLFCGAARIRSCEDAHWKN